MNFSGCISFDSYIKPQPRSTTCHYTYVVYLLIPTSNHNCVIHHWKFSPLYIFWFLHQTTTHALAPLMLSSCISFDSYIKPQPARHRRLSITVVYLLIPTSNHNNLRVVKKESQLYIFWFLHQTTTVIPLLFITKVLYIFWFLHQTTTSSTGGWIWDRCISFDSYIKPQLLTGRLSQHTSCISFDSYIKPQHEAQRMSNELCCISFDSYIKPQLSDHVYYKSVRCISFDSYIKPQPDTMKNTSLFGCISFDSYIKPQPIDLKVLISSV